MNPKRWTDNKDLIKTIIKNRPQRRLPPLLHTSPSKMLSIVVQATCLGIFPTISSNLFHFHQLASSTHHMTATKWEGMRFLWDAWSQPTATFWTAVPAMPLGSWTRGKWHYLPCFTFMKSRLASITLIDRWQKNASFALLHSWPQIAVASLRFKLMIP